MQSWYDEVKDYTYPYPHECNPWCPERCSGAMCTHYTQVTLRGGPGSAHRPQLGPAGLLPSWKTYIVIALPFSFNLMLFKV